MSNRGLMFVLMLVILCLVLPFIASSYNTYAFNEGGWKSERSSFVRYGLTESVLFPICIWYLLFMIVMFSVKEDEEVETKKKSRGKEEPR
jgi:hypothetical protein